jgi:23S rRNA (guanosine2251-2'-O)-methyltransferase
MPVGGRRGPKGAAGLEFVFGVHPVEEVIGSDRRRVDHLVVARGSRAGRIGRLLAEARRAGIPVRYVPREALERKLGRRVAHQGIAAAVSPAAYAEAEEVCRAAAADPAALLLLLDGIEDPRNLGAILRTAAAAGVRGVLLGGHRSVGITAAVAKTSAGAVERIAVAREPRPARRLAGLVEQGFRAVALEPGGEVAWDEADFSGRLVFVVGGEGRGVREGLRAVCHQRIGIPLAVGVDSLNVSVAVGIVLFEAVRQRRQLSSGARRADLERGETGW